MCRLGGWYLLCFLIGLTVIREIHPIKNNVVHPWTNPVSISSITSGFAPKTARWILILYGENFVSLMQLCVTHAIGTPGIALLAAIWSFVPLPPPDVLVFLFPALIYPAILVYFIRIYKKKGRGKQVKAHFLHSKYSNWYYELITCFSLIFLPLYAAIEIMNFFYK